MCRTLKRINKLLNMWKREASYYYSFIYYILEDLHEVECFRQAS